MEQSGFSLLRFGNRHFCSFAALLCAMCATISVAAEVPRSDYAHISSLTSAQLARICAQDVENTSNLTGISLSACNAYILGVADQLAIDRAFCLGSASYASTVVREVRQFLKMHPQRGAAPPVIVIRDALSAAFPCNAD